MGTDRRLGPKAGSRLHPELEALGYKGPSPPGLDSACGA